jgi:8-oxo-dGTP pyrophosphatase MutT (NUDIX family)
MTKQNDKDSMENMQWETLSSQYLYRDNWFTARRDRCRMPSGKIVDPYYVLEFPNWVNAAALTEDGNVLLIRQYRHALGETLLEIPGGCIDDTDASPLDAMKRELLEETGYAFTHIAAIGEISPNPSTNNNLTYMFLAQGGKKIQEQSLDPNEEIEVLTYSPAAAIKLLQENKIRQSLHATCLFYAFLKLGWLSFIQPAEGPNIP